MRAGGIGEDALECFGESREETEIAPGVFVARRLFLSAAALAAFSFLLSPAKAVAASSARAALNWDEFLAEAVPLAQRLLKESGSDFDYYLYRVAAVAVRLRGAPDAKLYPLGAAPGVSLAPSYKGPPFAAIQWRMEPGAVFPAHNHPNYSVCTVGLEGEARIRNYEVVGDAPAFPLKGSFRVRQTHDEIITAGRVNTLSPSRDNIHRFEAGRSGARGVDITTPHGPDVGFSFIEMGDKPADAGQRIYEAAWKNPGP
jgi:hypothetical protein